MQKICQKIVRVQNGLITEIYDGLMYRKFDNNDIALKELLMDDVGLDFEAMLHSYGQVIHDMVIRFPQLSSYLTEQLPEGWLEWAKEYYADEMATTNLHAANTEAPPIIL
ncbi:hypothetical protein [Paenibacillus agricola]|uniref:Uncharacterized protein n=1 Tax=Paenibacillus agricola TaxID=2716264 RepID=A0ABX0IY74_9BACL|nr:hypothetical protein [Paenibacillus agricola]NHN28817.1 hypothetical protein [Paenibacillus agricola]